MVKIKLACFFSGGYTEAAGYMQLFLRRINSDYEYEQCMPNSVRRRKGTPKDLKKEYSGITGKKLLKKVYFYLQKPYVREKFKSGIYGGVLIEDDLDGRYDNMDVETVAENEEQIRDKIHRILNVKCPVFFVYAAPEIESWFVADWNHGFGWLFDSDTFFKEYDDSIRKTFGIRLKNRVAGSLLKDGDFMLEHYAYATGEYRKLSTDLSELIVSLCTEVFSEKRFKEKIPNGTKSFYYSKRSHGPFMLKNIDPDIVREQCSVYFARSYLNLKNATACHLGVLG